MRRKKPNANGSADVFCGSQPARKSIGRRSTHGPILAQDEARLGGSHGMWAVVLLFFRAARLPLGPGD
jgi:hypothetical protein